MSPSSRELLDDLRELIQRREFETLEARWMDAVEVGNGNPPPDLEVILEAADLLLAADQRERASVLLEISAPLYEGRVEAADLLGLHRRRCLAAPGNRGVRQLFADGFRAVHGAESPAAVFLALSRVETASEAESAFADLDRWMLFQVGCHVFHPSGWGTGKVLSIDPILKQAVVDLEKKPNHRMEVQAMGSVLKPIPSDHFLVFRRYAGGKLQELAENEPAALVDCVVRSFGSPLELKEIKARLVPDIIPADGWTRWWGRAKKALRQGAYYRIQDRSPFLVERLEGPVSYEDDLLQAFRRGDWSQQRGLARKALKERGRSHPRLHEEVVGELARVIAGESGTRAIEAAALLDRFQPAGAAAGARLDSVLRSCADPLEAVLAIDGAEEQKAAVGCLPAILGADWPDAVLTLLDRGNDAIRDAVIDVLGEDSERATARVDDAARSPRSSPDLFAWAVGRLLSGDASAILRSLRALSNEELFERLLELVDSLAYKMEREGQPETRDSLARARVLVSSRSCALFRRVLDEFDPSRGRELYERLLSSYGLNDATRNELLEIITRKFPETSRPRDIPIWEESAVYVTEAGLRKRQDELRQLMEEKLPANFKDIGRAASFGDLSENAEFTAALETRDFLTKKAQEIQADLALARLITSSMLKTGEVTLGSRVTILNLSSGKEQTYRLLGPWDGDPDEGVVSYRSPLGRVFLGKTVGDEVEAVLPNGTEKFRILKVEPGIAES